MTSTASPHRVDVAVLGAGPAGTGAAVAAAAGGSSVLLIDEALAAGGQIYRKVPDALLTTLSDPGAADPGAADPDRRAGDALRRELDGSAVRTAFGWRVWSVMRIEDGFRIDAIGPDGPHVVEARALLAATGAVERILPFPGWTTPGVFGLAGATVLLKSQRTAPGRRVVVAGAGPLLAAVAAGVLKAGAEVAAVVDLNGPSDWLAAAPELALRPRLAARGAGWLLRLMRARVPLRFRAMVTQALGHEHLEAVEIASVANEAGGHSGATRRTDQHDAEAGIAAVANEDDGRSGRTRRTDQHDAEAGIAAVANEDDGRSGRTRRTDQHDAEAGIAAVANEADGRSGTTLARIDADALCIGYGLAPATELLRLLRAECVFDRSLGGWRPKIDALGRTSVSGLYVAGDGAGVLGGEAALLAGRTTGAAIAADLRGPAPTARASWSARRVRRFGAAMTRLTATVPAVAAAIPAETIVCRCEDITRAEIDDGYDAGARDINQLKQFTRCGMGPCQGRSCGEAAAELLALRMVADGRVPDVDAGRRRIGQWTGRAPLRPVPLSALVGGFSYADIPIPGTAPP